MRFHKVNIEISNVCNLQCSFCPEVIRAKHFMPLPLFETILDQVVPITDLVCFHLMGDPLVHPELESFVQICEKKGAKIYLVTNGLLLREKQEQILLSPAIQQINFSLHSFPDNFPERDPTLYLEKIFRFSESALAKNPDLYINYRLWNLKSPLGSKVQNHDFLERIRKHFQSDFRIDTDTRHHKSVKIIPRLYLNFDTEFIWPSPELPKHGNEGTCYGLRSHFGILADGTVVPCCLDKEGRIPLGNVKEGPIQEILSSPRAQKILKGFLNGRLEEDLCQRCPYIERFSKTARNLSAKTEIRK